MLSIVGPPSDTDIKHMQCSDVMAPLLSKYVAGIRRASAVKQQASSSDVQQQQLQGISAALKNKFRGAPDILLLILQRLLSFDPEFRISAGDAFVELLTSQPPQLLSPPSAGGAGAAGAVTVQAPPSPIIGTPPRMHKHPIDATLEGGHKGSWVVASAVAVTALLL